MRSFIVIFLISIFISSFTISLHAKIDKPSAIKGEIDLRNWNFNKNGTIQLNGDWEFYWKNYLTKSEKKVQPGYIKVPGNWNSYKIDYKKIPILGYGTYRLKVLLPDQKSDFGLKIPVICTASEIWINGKLVHKVGKLGINRKTTKPQTIPTEIYFPESAQEIEITIKVANYHDIWGGIKFPIHIGTRDQVQSLIE